MYSSTVVLYRVYPYSTVRAHLCVLRNRARCTLYLYRSIQHDLDGISLLLMSRSLGPVSVRRATRAAPDQRRGCVTACSKRSVGNKCYTKNGMDCCQNGQKVQKQLWTAILLERGGGENPCARVVGGAPAVREDEEARRARRQPSTCRASCKRDRCCVVGRAERATRKIFYSCIRVFRIFGPNFARLTRLRNFVMSTSFRALAPLAAKFRLLLPHDRRPRAAVLYRSS